MEPSLTKVYLTGNAETLGDIKRESWIFLENYEVFRRMDHSPESHGPAPIRLTEDCMFHAETTHMTLLPNSTYKADAEIGISL